MTGKRTILKLLNKNELQSIVATYDLAVSDKRVKDQLVEAAASSKKATLDNLLPELSRDRLKELCRALGQDDAGREKAALIERLTGNVRPPKSKISPKLPTGSEGGHEHETSASAPSKPRRAPKRTARTETPSADFEKNLWDTADKLRGTVESSEYKHVVLSLIFLKFISDKFEERRAQLIAEGKESYLDMVEFYAMKSVFYLPEEARWRFIKDRAKQDDIAVLLDTALSTVEKSNVGQDMVLDQDNRYFTDRSNLSPDIKCLLSRSDPKHPVGAAEIADDGIAFETKMKALTETLYRQMEEARELDAVIRKNLEGLGYGE